MQDNSSPFVFLLIVVVFICFGIWYGIDSYLIFRFEGKIKRGVRVWSKELSYDSQQYLLGLKSDVVEYQQLLFSKHKTSFIRVQNGEAIIFSTPRRFHSSWPYVGYVDLTFPNPELEYRSSLPGIIFLIPFTILGVIIFFVNFVYQTKSIDSFLENKTAEYIKLKAISSSL